MSEITFCNSLEYCEVHGHDIEFIDMTIIDIVDNQVKLERCRKCKKERETMAVRLYGDLRTSETTYPDGKWH